MEPTTLEVRCLHPVHYGTEHPRGAVIELPVKTANHLAEHKIVEILPTIVEPVEIPAEVQVESVPDPAPQETQAEAEEEAPKAVKKTSKRRIDSDDE
jgi:hypothetical protein